MSKSSKKNVPKKNSSVRPYTVMCTDLYLLWILLVYPLYYADGYFHLPERKATFWCTSTLIYIGVTLLGVIITYVSTRDEWSLERIKKNISMTDIFMFGFLISNLIAFALSEDKTNAWTGAGARYYGAKVLILVCISYFLISRYAWVNRVFIWAFLIGGNGVCLLATFDYFGMDVLGINQQMQASDWAVFVSTIGNVNTCASFVCMCMAGAMALFLATEKIHDKIFAGISLTISSIGLIASRSDSAYFGIGILIVLFLVLCLLNLLDLKKYLLELIIIDVVYFVFYLFVNYSGVTVLKPNGDEGVAKMLNQPILLLVLGIGLVILYGGVTYVTVKKYKDFLKPMYMVIAIAAIIVGVVMWRKLNLLGWLREGLGIHQNLVVGGRKYMLVKVSEGFQSIPFLNKIFGCGQASMSRIMNEFCGDELSMAGISINSAHNNILDYLIYLGICGVVCYLGIIITVIFRGIRKIKCNLYVIVPTAVIVAYFMQGFFNIEQIITTTFFWLAIAMMEALLRNIASEEI